MRRWIAVVICGVVAGATAGCAAKQARRTVGKPRGGHFYVVKPGDTIWRIARAWRIPVQDLAEWNNIQDADKINPGRRLYVPRVHVRTGTGRKGEKATYDDPIRLYHGRFQWPVDGPIYSTFGIRGSRRHDGVDIGAKSGTPIRAAADGVVAYNATLAGYGHLLILRHPDHFYTAYAHNARNAVKLDRRVRQGEVIAYVGATGRATGPHCHFEIRHGQKARNPLFFLPARNAEIARLKAEAQRAVGGAEEPIRISPKALRKARAKGKRSKDKK
ncbi:MAG: peptidoglycan DD-metalloendopeptidase family protein [Deltaproteobacteria bacterium]|nr:peptidoglycan DD-metalloendopeptidase family protein [Deltaproteobacteria bacterium]